MTHTTADRETETMTETTPHTCMSAENDHTPAYLRVATCRRCQELTAHYYPTTRCDVDGCKLTDGHAGPHSS